MRYFDHFFYRIKVLRLDAPAAPVRAMAGALRATPLRRRLFCRAVPQGREVHIRGCSEAQPADSDTAPISKPCKGGIMLQRVVPAGLFIIL
ncbi:MAG: hypothetical protein LBR08_09610, partial [Bacteroidales bacterium]|nr:hypothetical protein [Bacteroidales bacterium]